MTEAHTAVQHSGYGYGGDMQFEKGLEPRSLSKQSEVRAVLKAGGVVFANYDTAATYCEWEPYPRDYQGLIPAAPGTFASLKIDGLAVYVPSGGGAS